MWCTVIQLLKATLTYRYAGLGDTTLGQHVKMRLTESNIPLPHLSSAAEAAKQRCRRAGALPPRAGQILMHSWNFSLSLEK